MLCFSTTIWIKSDIYRTRQGLWLWIGESCRVLVLFFCKVEVFVLIALGKSFVVFGRDSVSVLQPWLIIESDERGFSPLNVAPSWFWGLCRLESGNSLLYSLNQNWNRSTIWYAKKLTYLKGILSNRSKWHSVGSARFYPILWSASPL